MPALPQRVLWVLDYFPRPHEPTTGVWGVETVLALARQGLSVTVLALTPWIPAWCGVTRSLRGWAAVPDRTTISDIQIYYPKAPYYPHRLVTRLVYHHVPLLDGPWLWRWCAAPVERMMQAHRFQLVHAGFVYPNGFIGREIARRYGIPLLVHELSPQRLAAAQQHPWRRRLYAKVMRDAAAVLTPNGQLAEQLRAMAPTQRIVVLPVGVDPPKSEACRQARPAAYQHRRVVLSVGALNERKGHAVLLQAMAQVRRRVPEAHLIIIGNGPQRRRLQQLAKTLGLAGSVELWGARPHAEVLAAMSWCDLFVLPSWGEAFGAVYAEALSFARPVIACAGEGFSEVARDEVHALLVAPRDPASLSRAILRLLTDAALAERLGRSGRALVDDALTTGAIAARLRAVYAECLA